MNLKTYTLFRAGMLAAAVCCFVTPSFFGQEKPGLRVATFRCDVTPPVGHPLIWVTSLETVEDPLWAKGIVLDDGKKRCVLCAMDWCGLCNSTHLLFRRKLAEASGADISTVALQCLHQHTAPYVDADAQALLDQQPNPPRFTDVEFLNRLSDRVAAAAKNSLGDLQPVDRIGTGEAKVQRVASTRRIPLADGTVLVRMSAGGKNPKLRDAPEGDIDPLLKTITLARGDRPLVRLHYYAVHPQSFYGDGRCSSDFPGLARERLEKEEGVFQIYFTGCAGDVTAGKYNDGSRGARDELVERLLAGMRGAIAATTLQPVGPLVWRSVPLRLRPRDDPGYTTAENREKMADAKLNPVVRIHQAALRIAFAQRSDRPLEVSSLQIGRVHILHLPGEPMIAFQHFAQQAKPGEFVAVAGYGDCGTGYLCTQRAFAEGGYEPTASRVAPDSEVLLQKAIRQLLGVE